MAGIIRKPTEAEKDLTPIGPDGETIGFINIGQTTRTARDKFNQELGKHIQATKKKLDKDGMHMPFCAGAATYDFEAHYRQEVERHQREYGYVKPDQIKPFKPDWSKYSDPKNFELIKEDEVLDDYLSKRNNVQVHVKRRKYKFKGYNFTVTVMEDQYKALERAKKAAKV